MIKSSEICIVSAHPLVLPEWRRLLSGGGFQIHARHVEFTPKVDLHQVALPPASVYVVDANGPEWAIETLLAGIREHHHAARVIVAGHKFTPANTFPLFHLGVRGVVRYTELNEQLMPAVHNVQAGRFWAPRELISGFVESLLESGRNRMPLKTRKVLSRREKEILDGLLKNLSNKELAQQLHISESTVKFHVSHVLSKFSVQRRADLIVRCFQETAA